MPSDLPDYTRYITQQIEVPQAEQGPVIPRPLADKGDDGSNSSLGTAFTTIAEYAPADGKSFHAAYVFASCEEDYRVQVRWDGSVVFGPVYCESRIPFTMFFPWGRFTMPGDGSKKVDVQMRVESGTAAAYADIRGEEV
ncbi:MAG: hypothetical protein ACE5OO_00385 [Candidatus Bathyarchaeia archaeon]